MARKRKKTTRRTTRRRRGVGAINTGGMLAQVGGVIAGVAAAGYVTKIIGSAMPNVKAETAERIQQFLPIAAGVALPMFPKNNPLIKNIGLGMIAYGGGKFLQKAGLGELENEPTETIMISGDDLSVIAGDDEFAMAGDEISVLAGIENC